MTVLVLYLAANAVIWLAAYAYFRKRPLANAVVASVNVVGSILIFAAAVVLAFVP